MSSGLARVGEPPISQWSEMQAQAKVLVNSGFLPNHIKTAEQAIAVMMTGEDLGIPKMLALRSINVINGKPALSADLMASLVMREIDRHKDGRFTVTDTTPQECRITYRRWGEREEQEFVFTEADARTAGLWGKAGPWSQHPGQMLRARATSNVCRMAFPDVVAGLYTPDELLEGEPVGRVEVGPIVELVPNKSEQRQRSLRDRVDPQAIAAEVIEATPTNAEAQDREHDVVVAAVVVDTAGKPVDDDEAEASEALIVHPISGQILPQLFILTHDDAESLSPDEVRAKLSSEQLIEDMRLMSAWLMWDDDALKQWYQQQGWHWKKIADLQKAHAALEDMIGQVLDA